MSETAITSNSDDGDALCYGLPKASEMEVGKKITAACIAEATAYLDGSENLTGRDFAIFVLDKFDGTFNHAFAIYDHLDWVGRDDEAKAAITVYLGELDAKVERGACTDEEYARYLKCGRLI